MLDLHDKCIVPAILYGCETWTINKKQMEAIENMQLYSLRRILKTPQTTPKVAIYGETGTLKLEEKIKSRQVIYLQKVLSQESYRWTRLCAEQQIKYCSEQPTIMKKILQIPAEYELPDDLEGIRNYDPKEWRNRVKREIRMKANREYQTEQNESSKMKYFSDYKYELKRKKYIEQLPCEKAREVFKFRSKMMDLRMNYKNIHKY